MDSYSNAYKQSSQRNYIDFLKSKIKSYQYEKRNLINTKAESVNANTHNRYVYTTHTHESLGRTDEPKLFWQNAIFYTPKATTTFSVIVSRHFDNMHNCCATMIRDIIKQE